MANRGAPRGNQNARKHGFYSRLADEVYRCHLRAAGVDPLDAEIAILHLKLEELVYHFPRRKDLYLAAIGAIAHLVRRRYQLAAASHLLPPSPGSSPDSPPPAIPPSHARSHRTRADDKA